MVGRDGLPSAPRWGGRVAEMAAKYPAPKGLKGSLGFWRKITKKFELRDDELRILEDSCREMDLIDRLEEALEGADLTVRGSQGQPVANPLVQEVRQHRGQLKSLLGSLKLPDEPGEAAGSSRSESARKAAEARWRRTG